MPRIKHVGYTTTKPPVRANKGTQSEVTSESDAVASQTMAEPKKRGRPSLAESRKKARLVIEDSEAEESHDSQAPAAVAGQQATSAAAEASASATEEAGAVGAGAVAAKATTVPKAKGFSEKPGSQKDRLRTMAVKAREEAFVESVRSSLADDLEKKKEIEDLAEALFKVKMLTHIGGDPQKSALLRLFNEGTAKQDFKILTETKASGKTAAKPIPRRRTRKSLLAEKQVPASEQEDDAEPEDESSDFEL